MNNLRAHSLRFCRVYNSRLPQYPATSGPSPHMHFLFKREGDSGIPSSSRMNWTPSLRVSRGKPSFDNPTSAKVFSPCFHTCRDNATNAGAMHLGLNPGKWGKNKFIFRNLPERIVEYPWEPHEPFLKVASRLIARAIDSSLYGTSISLRVAAINLTVGPLDLPPVPRERPARRKKLRS